MTPVRPGDHNTAHHLLLLYSSKGDSIFHNEIKGSLPVDVFYSFTYVSAVVFRVPFFPGKTLVIKVDSDCFGRFFFICTKCLCECVAARTAYDVRAVSWKMPSVRVNRTSVQCENSNVLLQLQTNYICKTMLLHDFFLIMLIQCCVDFCKKKRKSTQLFSNNKI